MIRGACFTLGILILAPLHASRAGASSRSGSLPAEQIETTPDQNETGDSDADSDDLHTNDSDASLEPDDRDPDDAEKPIDDDAAGAVESKRDLDSDREAAPGAVELELTTAAGTRGEGSADALVRFTRGAFSYALGAGSGGGSQAVQREWLRAGLAWDPGVALSLSARWQPQQSGAEGEQLECSASGTIAQTTWQLAIAQETAQLSSSAAGFATRTIADPSGTAFALSSATGAAELTHAIGELAAGSLRATAHAGGGIFLLAMPKSAQLSWSALTPWDRLGLRALAWPSRADGSLGLSLENEAGSAAFSLGAGLPAAAGDFETEATLSCERKFGRAIVSLALSAAHLSPSDQWLGSLTFSARWRFGSG